MPSLPRTRRPSPDRTARPRSRRYRYETCCVDCGAGRVPALIAMIDHGRAITWRTFRRAVDPTELQRRFPQYAWGPGTRGLRMANDYAVRWYRSTFEGRPCVFVVWSAIEFIFVAPRADGLSRPEPA